MYHTGTHFRILYSGKVVLISESWGQTVHNIYIKIYRNYYFVPLLLLLPLYHHFNVVCIHIMYFPKLTLPFILYIRSS